MPRWVDQVAAGRPYQDTSEILAAAGQGATALTEAEVDAAVSRHPRIGEPAGDAHDAELSRREQAGVEPADEAALSQLAVGNWKYESRFGRVFLIRVAGRSSAEILAELHRRLRNDQADEAAEVGTQLREIALLRLELLVAGDRGQEVAL